MTKLHHVHPPKHYMLLSLTLGLQSAAYWYLLQLDTLTFLFGKFWDLQFVSLFRKQVGIAQSKMFDLLSVF